MFSIRLNEAAATAALVLAWTQPATAMQPAREDAPVATRTVVVQQAALQGDSGALADLNHKLFVAAKIVCAEEYPKALIFVARICVSETLADAVKELNLMRSRQPIASATPARQVALAVKAR